MTIQSLLEGTFNEEVTDHYNYLFRDETTILYVGRAIDILSRLRAHLGEVSHTQIGRLIRANKPKSNTWQVELFTVQEFGKKPPFTWQQVDEVEQEMIMKYKPCLNIE